ncbi:hypothetical protein PYCCODRAFT_320012 [Trametes coccinea BRFM310]|uniref:Uncharacterized protein n=1 Tax=Trametes coccinea (strain BRFM310) TaxID=1353009 RepID=A0A1Y2IN72_TRAC3|nr:hypothetical protein PYCCODRAFT_320012 [Trametes coccinea BRFM310]
MFLPGHIQLGIALTAFCHRALAVSSRSGASVSRLHAPKRRGRFAMDPRSSGSECGRGRRPRHEHQGGPLRAEVTELLSGMTGSRGGYGGVKMYRWVKCMGDWTLSICIDRQRDKDATVRTQAVIAQSKRPSLEGPARIEDG